MANSYISQLGCRDSIVLKGRSKAIYANGKLAAQYYPGTVVYKTDNNSWTATGGLTADRYHRIGVVEFIYRTDSAFGATSIDGYITDGTVRNCKILVGPRGDPDFEFAAFFQTHSAAVYGMAGVMASSSGRFKLATEKIAGGGGASHFNHAFTADMAVIASSAGVARLTW